MVVTNLRMPQSNYLQIKAIAGELGMSVNAYITTILNDAGRQQMLRSDTPKKSRPSSRRQSLYKAFVALSKMPNKPTEASEDDKIIYGV